MTTLFRLGHREQRSNAWDHIAERYADRSSFRNYSGEPVNDDSAMRLGAVWGCVDLIAELVSTLPVDEYRKVNDVPTAIGSTFLEDPAGDGSGFEVWARQVMVSALVRGNAFGFITSVGTNGWPRFVEPLHPDRITLQRDRSFGPVDWYLDNNPIERWPNGPLWHLPAYPVAGTPVGLSPISYAAQTIGLGLAAQKFGAQWFGDGMHPTSVFTSPMAIGKDQAEVVKERIRQAMHDTREPLVLGNGLSLNPIAVPPNESQFLETIKANADDIAKFFFRRPPGEGGQVTYANVEARSIDLLTYTLNGWLVRLERSLTRLRPKPRYVKFNADALLRVDTATRYKAHDTAIRAGWKNPDEVRATEDLPPIPDGGGKEYLWPPYATAPAPPETAPGGADAD